MSMKVVHNLWAMTRYEAHIKGITKHSKIAILKSTDKYIQETLVCPE